MLFPDGSAERTHSVQRFLDQRFFSNNPFNLCHGDPLCTDFAVRDASDSEYSFPCHRKSNTPQLATKVQPFTTLVSL